MMQNEQKLERGNNSFDASTNSCPERNRGFQINVLETNSKRLDDK
jgi:hypothetical protein